MIKKLAIIEVVDKDYIPMFKRIRVHDHGLYIFEIDIQEIQNNTKHGISFRQLHKYHIDVYRYMRICLIIFCYALLPWLPDARGLRNATVIRRAYRDILVIKRRCSSIMFFNFETRKDSPL